MHQDHALLFVLNLKSFLALHPDLHHVPLHHEHRVSSMHPHEIEKVALETKIEMLFFAFQPPPIFVKIQSFFANKRFENDKTSKIGTSIDVVIFHLPR